MRKPPCTISLLFLGVLLTSCRGCGDKGPGALLELASAEAPGVIWIPDLGDAAGRLEAFLGRATRKAGAGAVRRVRESLTKQLGFDPLLPSDYEKAGLRPGAGLLVFVEPPGQEPLVALGVHNRARFDTALQSFITATDGADKFTPTDHHGRKVLTAGRPFGTEVAPAFHWVHVGDYVLIARAEGLDALDRALARLTPEATAAAKSLGSESAFLAGQKSVPAGQLLAFARGRGAPGAAPGTQGTTSVTWGDEGFGADVFVSLPVEGLPAALGTEPTLPLAARIEPNAVALLLSRAARPDGIRAVRAYPAAAPLMDRLLKPLTTATGVDVEKDVLPLLKGPLTVSVHVGDVAALPTRLKEMGSAQAVLDVVQVAVTAELANAEGMTAFLEDMRGELFKRGVALGSRKEKVAGRAVTVWEPTVPDPKLGWAVMDPYYVYGAGSGRLRATLEGLARGDSDLPSKLKDTVGGKLAAQPGSVLVLRSGIVADAAAQLALGGDTPGARVGLGALVGGLVELIRTVGDVGVALRAEPDGLRLTLREQLQ
jgi:hypothetical protein